MRKGKGSIWRILWGCVLALLLGLKGSGGLGGSVGGAVEGKDGGAAEGGGASEALHGIYAEDERLRLISHEEYAYRADDAWSMNYLYQQYMWAARRYDEEEMAEFCHAQFDDQNRLRYMLGYSSSILGSGSSYCEENIYQWDDVEHTCRYLYCKSNSKPYMDGYYIAFRYLFEADDFQFDREGRLLSCLTYRRNVGSDPYGYSEELFFDRGYQAEYDGEYLTAELQYYDYWGTNETGAWEYRVYQYNQDGACTKMAAVTEDGIVFCCYEYDEGAGKVEEYVYQVEEDWELPCADGNVYYFSPQWGSTAVKKVAADKTVERELFYGKAMDLGQQHYLMPEEVEKEMDDHVHVAEPGDCLWKIAAERYGQGGYYDLVYRMNRSVIGGNPDFLLPGTRLYLPEAGNAQDTRIRKT